MSINDDIREHTTPDILNSLLDKKGIEENKK